MKKKITNIKFLTKNEILVTTNDNRIRIMNINDGSVIQKFKGHKNMEGMLKCDFCENYEVIISPSEDGYVYLWNIKKNKKKVEKKEKEKKLENEKVNREKINEDKTKMELEKKKREEEFEKKDY